MAWPFVVPSVGPNINTSTVAVPTSATSIDSAACWVMGMVLSNSNDTVRIVTLTEEDGSVIGVWHVYKGAPVTFSPPLMPSIGVKWSADFSGVVGRLWAYK